MNKEKQIIQAIKNSLSPSAQSQIGDDCAYLASENLLLSTDALVEGIHFLKTADSAQLTLSRGLGGKTYPYYLGWKAVAVSISDIAAMGGLPTYFLLSASLPPHCKDDWVIEFLKGINECCAQYSTSLIGGDLTGSDKIYLCGTIIGKAVNGKVAKRSYAKAGQKILVSGKFGSSAAGLWAMQNSMVEQFPELVEAHLKPIPRVQEGFDLLQNSQSPVAMMDASDGLLDCLQQISEQSKVKLTIDLSKVPTNESLLKCSLAAGVDPNKWVLTGGEDYELVATSSEAYNANVWTAIGEVTEGTGVEVKQKDKFFDVDALKIFDHFC